MLPEFLFLLPISSNLDMVITYEEATLEDGEKNTDETLVSASPCGTKLLDTLETPSCTVLGKEIN